MSCPLMVIEKFLSFMLERSQGDTLVPYLSLVPLEIALIFNTKILKKEILYF